MFDSDGIGGHLNSITEMKQPMTYEALKTRQVQAFREPMRGRRLFLEPDEFYDYNATDYNYSDPTDFIDNYTYFEPWDNTSAYYGSDWVTEEDCWRDLWEMSSINFCLCASVGQLPYSECHFYYVQERNLEWEYMYLVSESESQKDKSECSSSLYYSSHFIPLGREWGVG